MEEELIGNECWWEKNKKNRIRGKNGKRNR